MVDYQLITGTLIQSYNICHRQTWLMAHQIVPDQEQEYIELGRIIDKESYSRDKKRINFENVIMDLVRSDDENLIVGEVKKSSRAKKSAKMQVVFYLYKLKQKGIKAHGLLLFPKERKRELVELTPELEQELESIFSKIYKIIFQETPPRSKKQKYCKKCGYREFCWA